jgi:hypothetical protein
MHQVHVDRCLTIVVLENNGIGTMSVLGVLVRTRESHHALDDGTVTRRTHWCALGHGEVDAVMHRFMRHMKRCRTTAYAALGVKG